MKFIHFSGPKKNFQRGQRIDYKQPKINQKTPRIEHPIGINFKLVYFIITLLLFLGGYWWVIFTDFFTIKEIVIDGSASNEILEEIMKLKGKNILQAGGGDVEKTLMQKQPGIKQINIIRGLPNTLKIELFERDSALTWESQSKKYLVDMAGVPFKEVEKTKHFLIKDTDNLAVEFGDPIIEEDFITFAQFVDQEIPLRTDFKISHFEIVETTYQLIIVGENGKKIYLNTMRQPEPQLNAFKKVYDEMKNEIQEYIDTRVEGLVYYK